MSSLPLHPAIVHLPLGLAFVMPALAAGFAWALWTGRVRARAWIVIVALQALVLGAGLVAMNTGEREEERVEAIVPDSAIHEHEERAEQFVWMTGVTLMLAGMVVVLPWRRAAQLAALATVAAAVVATVAAVRTGEAGGRLVYAHNAGAAYSQPLAPAATEAHTSRERPDQDVQRRDRRERHEN